MFNEVSELDKQQQQVTDRLQYYNNLENYNKILTDYPSAEKLVDGEVGTIWYSSGSGQLTTSSDKGDQKFLQLTVLDLHFENIRYQDHSRYVLIH